MKGRAMRTAGLIGLAAGLSGCAVLLVGAGAAGGYAVSADSIRNQVEAPYEFVYGISQEVLSARGLILEEDRSRGRLKAEVEGVKVTVTVKRLGAESVELKVRARNQWLMPRMAVAERVYNEIMQGL